ncbi:MAG: helix-turn-helix domain-containing protein [Burkholderiales bacterium]
MAGLSSSRFQHVFRDAVGVPFRRYRLWRRMAFVARALGRKTSLTEAAHQAGFSSSAHLSSSFRAMFGSSPSSLLTAGCRIECS